MTPERRQLPTGRDLPDAGVAVVAGGHDEPAAGPEVRVEDGCRMSELGDEAMRGDAPDARGVVGGRRDEQASVVAERHSLDRSRVAAEHRHLSPLVVVSRTAASTPVDARSFPSGERSTESTSPACRTSASCRPVRASQTRAVSSSLAVATSFPSAENVTATTGPSWRSVATVVPSDTRKTRAMPSLLAVARSSPSGLNSTSFPMSSWAASWRTTRPVRASCTPGGPAEAMTATRRPSARTRRFRREERGAVTSGRRIPDAARHAAGRDRTRVRAERRGRHDGVRRAEHRVRRPSVVSQTFAVSSALPVASRRPSALNVTEVSHARCPR